MRNPKFDELCKALRKKIDSYREWRKQVKPFLAKCRHETLSDDDRELVDHIEQQMEFLDWLFDDDTPKQSIH
jgi:hypothetical protein